MPARRKTGGTTDPHYIEIANQLREELVQGKFKPGQRFYSIRALIRETKRSLPTVRSAINLLVKENFLEPRVGSGYYVTDKVNAKQKKAVLNFLVVMPGFTGPTEPWFTGKIVTGMIQATEENEAIISYFIRKLPRSRKKKDVEEELEKILSTRPDGVAWLHIADVDAPVISQLLERGMPVVGTMRKIPELDLTLLRENDELFAAILLSQFQARGHRHLGVISNTPTNEYFESKINALKGMCESMNITLNDSDFFYREIPNNDFKKEAQDLKKFLQERKHLTGLILLASKGINAIINLMKTPYKSEMEKLSFVYNVLDGFAIPELPTGDSLATISPPLTKLGEQLVTSLYSAISKKPGDPQPQLIPEFKDGTTLKHVAVDPNKSE